MKKSITLLFTLYLFLFSGTLLSQNNMCGSADPFCTGTTYNFPAGVNAGQGQVGPNYGCLYSQPNPAWYYMQIANPGPIIIEMHSTPQYDIDFACWGPFTSPTAPCVAQLTASCTSCYSDYPHGSYPYPYGNLVDCSYSTSWTETCGISNGVTGEWYILLITNFSNSPCNIIFSQVGGTGTTNCGILAPPIIGDTVCVGQTIQLTVTNPTPGATYSWTGPNGFTSSLMNPTIPNATSANSGVYSLVITVGLQTSPAVTCTVLVNPNPVIAVVGDTVCEGFPATITASGGSTYVWNNSTTLNPMIISPLVTTTYSVTGTDTNGCVGTASGTVTVNPNPVVNAGIDQSICTGTSANLSASPAGATTYTWDNGAGNTQNVTVSPMMTTLYSLTVTDANGCSGTDAVNVVVNPGAAAEAGNDQAICAGFSATLSASGGISFIWNDGVTTATNIVSPNVTTVYSVTVSNNNGCSGTDLVTVTVNQNPVPSITTTGAVCGRNDGTASALPAGLNYLWSNQETTQQILNLHPGLYSLTVTDANGCTNTTSAIVDDIPGPMADFAAVPNLLTLIEDPLCIFMDHSTGATQWQWSFGDGTFSNQQFVSHEYTAAGFYTVLLVVTDEQGCVDSTQIVIEVKDLYTIYIPNAFTPNGDGTNDVFGVYGKNIDTKDFEMVIYNRWGEKVFYTNDPTEFWNGTLNNKGEKNDGLPGAYSYKVTAKEVNGKVREYFGHVSLIR